MERFRTRHSRSRGRMRLSAHPDTGSFDPETIKQLPITAQDFFGDEQKTKVGWEGILKMILTGTRDDKSDLKILRYHEKTLVRNIYSYLGCYWASHVKLTIPAALVGQHQTGILRFDHGRALGQWSRRKMVPRASATSRGFENAFVSYVRCGRVDFPTPTGRNVNMMPFILGDQNSLPEGLQCYHELIEKCPYKEKERGKIGYLTVHECYVDTGKAQRREGLHIESPGVFCDDPNASAFTPGREHPWGIGIFYGPDEHEGGIYMASSVCNTSKVWNALVDCTIPGIVDKHGGCEYLRPLLGEGTELEAGELIWMTDCTPHEALPQEVSGYRQFFRVVTPYVSHWFADHSTKNPKVTLPEHVTVIHGNKFK